MVGIAAVKQIKPCFGPSHIVIYDQQTGEDTAKNSFETQE